MNELALFAGAGGGILGGMLCGWRTVCAVEIEDYPRRVLLQRQADGILPRFPIWDNVCTFDGKPWRGKIDVISGGFPCQDISAAGKGAGITGERSGLWKEYARIIGEVRPRFAFVENSPMLTVRGLGAVLGDLASLGYDARWCVLGACDAGAPHKRERIWIVANAQSERAGDERQNKRAGRDKINAPHDAGCFGGRNDKPAVWQDVADACLHGHVAAEICRSIDAGGDGSQTGQKPTSEFTGLRPTGINQDVADSMRDRSQGQRTDGNATGPTRLRGGTGRDQEQRVSWWDIDPADVADTTGRESGEPEAWDWRQGAGGGGEEVGDPDGVNGWTGAGRGDGEEADDASIEIPDTENKRLLRGEWSQGESGQQSESDGSGEAEHECGERRTAEPGLGRVAHGVAHRVDRLRAIGNGQVPAVVRLAWEALT